MTATDPGSRLSRAQEIAADVEAEILDLGWPEGQRLGLRTDMMERYTASPTVINEALRILREHQMVEVRRGSNGGVFVAARPPHVRLTAVHLWFHHTNVSPAWMFELRVRVEMRAVPEAFARASLQEIERLEERLGVMANTSDAAEYLDAAFAFHHILVEASGDELLTEMHRMLLTVLRVSRARAAFSPGAEAFRARSVEIHRQLIDALHSRDQEAFMKWARTQYETMLRAGVDQSSSEAVRISPVWAGLSDDDTWPVPDPAFLNASSPPKSRTPA